MLAKISTIVAKILSMLAKISTIVTKISSC